MEKDLESAKAFIQTLKESEDEQINGMTKEGVIQGCSSFVDNFKKFQIEAQDMFTDLNEDFLETKQNLIKEAQKYGEDEDVKPTDILVHIYNFGKEFNEALKNMVCVRNSNLI